MIEVDEKRLGQRLQEARKAANLTQQDLCHKAKLSYSTLAKIERGAIKSPSIFTIQQIAHVLGTSLDALVGMPSVPATAPKKQSRSGIRFVYFDVNGCLVRFFQRAFTKLAEETDRPADTIETTFWHYNDAVCRGEMSLADFNAVLQDELAIPNVDWQKYYLDAIEPIKEMQDLVVWASEHYHVGLLSNIMPGFINEMLAKKLLPNVTYDAIVDSSVVGSIKPELKMYDTAVAAAKFQPAEILLVDDSRTNLMAAERQGWHVLWLDDYRPEETAARIRKALEPIE
jgi:FMN phosphatase YigB (HAD superfamily)